MDVFFMKRRRTLSDTTWCHLSFLVCLHTIWPYPFYCLAILHYVATETVLKVVLPFTCPLPTISIIICSITFSTSFYEISTIFLSTLPFDFSMTFKTTLQPVSSYGPSVVHYHQSVTWKLVIFEGSAGRIG